MLEPMSTQHTHRLISSVDIYATTHKHAVGWMEGCRRQGPCLIRHFLGKGHANPGRPFGGGMEGCRRQGPCLCSPTLPNPAAWSSQTPRSLCDTTQLESSQHWASPNIRLFRYSGWPDMDFMDKRPSWARWGLGKNAVCKASKSRRHCHRATL